MKYRPGDPKCVCDRCGFVRYRSECRKEWTGWLVCADTCWEERHPQETIQVNPEVNRIKDARPEPDNDFIVDSSDW